MSLSKVCVQIQLLDLTYILWKRWYLLNEESAIEQKVSIKE